MRFREKKKKKNDDLKNNITFSGLLNTMDGIAHVDKQIIIMTTNHPLVLNAALKRPGRVDLTFEFKYSSKSQIKTMFERFLPNQKDNFSEFYCRIKKSQNYNRHASAILLWKPTSGKHT